MMRIWIGNALLAGSWLLGLSYFAPARPVAWFCMLAAATVLLTAVPVRWPRRGMIAASLGLALLAALVMPWPYQAIGVLLAGGLALRLPTWPRAWPRQLGTGAVVASGILLAQAVALHGYIVLTARVHELPGLLAEALAVVARSLGIDATAAGGTVVLRDVEVVQRIAATWELLFDPASVLFLVGGLVCLTLLAADCPAGWWRRAAGRLVLVFLAWAPLRTALLMAVLIHRALRADYLAAPNVGDLFVNSLLHVLLLAGLVALSSCFVGRRPVMAWDAESRNAPAGPGRGDWGSVFRPALLTAVGTMLLVGLYAWDPVGRPKSGRVMVVERHSTWEPTTVPYGTGVYGEAGSYNYAAIYDYAGQFFEMSRLLESQAIDDDTLGRCDVLIIKTPTARYAQEEAAAVARFVERGGSLLMIGDHTNVFNMNTYLNDVSRHFGFTFRNDLLFCVASPYTQRYRPPRLAHPLLQHVPAMNFAVSCSIDPGRSTGRMVVRNTGLWSLPPAYHEMNYHPQAEYRPDMQYGAWCQLWATRYGAGRVLGFADSTLFSNFCTFQPGKAELFIGMLQWLNHRSVLDRAWAWWLLVAPAVLFGCVLIVAGLVGIRGITGGWIQALAAILAGGALAALVVTAANRRALPWPAAVRPLPHVVIDRELSRVPLFTGAFADDPDGLGYGMFEQWIPRLGSYLSRRQGREVFLGDALVVICPTGSVNDEYRRRLERFVAEGGWLLIVDSADVEGSTANGLLEPFGLASRRAAAVGEPGRLAATGSDIELSCPAANQILGGETIAWRDGLPVAARVRYQRGQVTAIGFGSLFNDAGMGFHWLPEPDADTLQRYEVLYALLRSALPTSPRRPTSSPFIASQPTTSHVPDR